MFILHFEDTSVDVGLIFSLICASTIATTFHNMYAIMLNFWCALHLFVPLAGSLLPCSWNEEECSFCCRCRAITGGIVWYCIPSQKCCLLSDNCLICIVLLTYWLIIQQHSIVGLCVHMLLKRMLASSWHRIPEGCWLCQGNRALPGNWQTVCASGTRMG